jgi:hypothetical protein
VVLDGATTRRAGRNISSLSQEREMFVAPAGAAALRVTVQAEVAPGPRVAGVQLNEEMSSGGATRKREADWELPFKLAVTTTAV